jgi:hypothetical protein
LPAISKRASCGLTARKLQSWLSPPVGSLTILSDVSSRKTPTCTDGPRTVPISTSAGRSGDDGANGGGASAGAGAAATAGGAGGRRDTENSGRARVAEREAKGSAHNGLPDCTGPTAAARRERSDLFDGASKKAGDASVAARTVGTAGRAISETRQTSRPRSGIEWTKVRNNKIKREAEPTCLELSSSRKPVCRSDVPAARRFRRRLR